MSSYFSTPRRILRARRRPRRPFTKEQSPLTTRKRLQHQLEECFNNSTYLSAVRRLMSSEPSTPKGRASQAAAQGTGDVCPSCRLPFDKAKKRRLVDTCGHQRCYSCMFKKQECPLCAQQGSSPCKLRKSGSGAHLTSASSHGGSEFLLPQSPALSVASSRFGGRSRTQSPGLQGPVSGNSNRQLYGAVTVHQQPEQPPLQQQGQRRYAASPKLYRSPWLQHQRRSHLLNDSGNGSNSGIKGDADMSKKSIRSGSTDPSSHSRESGFQSSTSLTSLEHAAKSSPDENSPVSTLNGSSEDNDCPAVVNNNNVISVKRAPSQNSADSLVSLISGLSDSASCQLGGSRRHSVNALRQTMGIADDSNSRKSALRRSARLQQQQQLQPTYRQLYWTLKPLFFEVPTSEPNSLFMGRQWLYREISEHLTSDLPTNKGVIITGSPGTGKTAVILQLVEHSCFGRGDMADLPNLDQSVESIYGQSQMSLALATTQAPNSMKILSSQIVAYHFCQNDNAPTCLVPEFVHSLAAQLSQAPQLTPYFQLVNADQNLQSLLSLPGCVADPSQAFVQGIMEPLKALRRLGRLSPQTCLLVIDGLCAAELHRPDHGHTLCSFLAKHLLDFPEWLKIVCSVRTGMQDISKTLPFQRISLDKTDVDERLTKDMTDYILYRISRSPPIQSNITPLTPLKQDGASPQARITQFLVGVARGCFLYVKMTLDLLERGHLVIKSSSFNVLPLSLSQIFLLEFNLKFPSLKSFEKVSDLLSAALASLVPLTPVELFTSINALHEDASIQWGEFLMRFSALNGFLLRRADDTVMFCHPTFREWLIRRRDFESAKFVCDPRIGHAAIAFKMCRCDAPLTPDKTLELGHHILKGHIYKNMLGIASASEEEEAVSDLQKLPSRDLQAMWVAMSSEDVSVALGAVRNVSSPNVKVSRLLLLAGASPDHISDYLNNAPLVCVFANQGYVDMVSLLIEFGADLNAVNSAGQTALMFAAKQGHLDLVRVLVQHAATINLIDKCEACALVAAAKAGNLNTVNFLVSCDWPTDAVNDLGLAEAAQQAMVTAAEQGHEQVLEFLLDMAEVHINRSDTLTGNTALCAAAGAGEKRCGEVLLRRGAKVGVTNLKEAPPLHMAIAGGHWDVTEVLLKEGASLEQPDSLGRTPLMIASLEGHSAVLELLLSKHALLEARDNDGLSALGWACLKGRGVAVQCLLDQGVDFNYADKHGRSPLDLAAYRGDAEVVQLLLERGAVMEHVDVNGMRPLDRAIQEGHSAAVMCFLKKGAKLGPATWALANSRPEIMTILLNKLLEDGNTLFRKNRFEDAAHRYQYALKRLPTDSSSVPDTFDHTTFDQIKVHLLLNLSRCKRKQGDLREAAVKASEVLLLRPSCLEALQARARANREDGRHEEAITDLAEALRLSPQNREIHKMMIKVKEELRAANNNNGGLPIGLGRGEKIKFLDDASSVATSTMVSEAQLHLKL